MIRIYSARTSILFFMLCVLIANVLKAQQPIPVKPRILISTDIGGTDPDDNQSMTHLLMYSELFTIEGLVSSPSYGRGSKAEILRMIDLYEKDLPKLKNHKNGLASPVQLRSVTKQGHRGSAHYKGYAMPTEGSEWIITCANRTHTQPLWVLVWGGLEDLAQALHDAPVIQSKLRVYWIGGPNKKWSANSYAYIAANFPDLWFIEVNASYYGLFSDNEPDSVAGSNYYDKHIKGRSFLGRDFKNYYNGNVKMGDTPSLLYMMDGDPNNPGRESWGGSFDKIAYSSRAIFNRATNEKDTVAFCSIMEFHLKGPVKAIHPDSICFWMNVPYGKSVQRWPGYYAGNDDYVIRYIPKKAEVLTYDFTSDIPELNGQKGKVVVVNSWPGKRSKTDYPLGKNWYSDKANPNLYYDEIPGGRTIVKWRNSILSDWALRWEWLNAEE